MVKLKKLQKEREFMYNFSYFSPIHIETFVVSGLFCVLLLYIPKFFKKVDLKKYSIFLGYFLLFFKVVDSVYRVIYQNEPIYNVMLVHLCNFVAIFAAFYLIFRTEYLYNVVYYLSFGPVLALILPGITNYYNNYYVYIFMIMHALIVFAAVFGAKYLNGTPTKKGLFQSIITLLGIFLYAVFYNYLFKDVNAMFLREYIAPKLFGFVKPFWVYRVGLITVMILLEVLLYFFSKIKIKSKFD